MEWDGMKRYENRREVEQRLEHRGKEREKMDDRGWEGRKKQTRNCCKIFPSYIIYLIIFNYFLIIFFTAFYFVEIKKIVIIDLDVHQGNGTHALSNWQHLSFIQYHDIFILSFYFYLIFISSFCNAVMLYVVNKILKNVLQYYVLHSFNF